ncbi:MAG TPA: hypothetical protein VF644_14695 [Pyrinomonadaceae bacterium]|jgi:hypothetical protein
MKETYREAQGIKFSETKGACDLAYHAVEGERYKFTDEKVWKVVRKIERFLGFRAVIIQAEDSFYKPILAFAGTDPTSVADIFTDAHQAVGGIFVPQYWFAVLTANEAKGRFGDLVLTGHSLGGGLAAYASLVTGASATTINPAPLNSSNTLIGLMKNLKGKVNITNYICGTKGWRKGEVVTSLISPGFIVGEKIYVAGADGAGFHTRHKLENTGAGVNMPTKVSN